MNALHATAQPANAKPEKLDQRIVRTRDAVEAALLHLLATQHYDKITITALAKAANVDRKTFYAHYCNIEDVLHSLITRSVAKGFAHISWYTLMDDTVASIEQLLHTWIDATNLTVAQAQAIIEHIPFNSVLHYWCCAIQESIFAQLQPVDAKAQEQLAVLLNLYTGGVFNAIVRWIMTPSTLTLDEVLHAVSIGIGQNLHSLLQHFLLRT